MTKDVSEEKIASTLRVYGVVGWYENSHFRVSIDEYTDSCEVIRRRQLRDEVYRN